MLFVLVSFDTQHNPVLVIDHPIRDQLRHDVPPDRQLDYILFDLKYSLITFQLNSHEGFTVRGLLGKP